MPVALDSPFLALERKASPDFHSKSQTASIVYSGIWTSFLAFDMERFVRKSKMVIDSFYVIETLLETLLHKYDACVYVHIYIYMYMHIHTVCICPQIHAHASLPPPPCYPPRTSRTPCQPSETTPNTSKSENKAGVFAKPILNQCLNIAQFNPKPARN